MKAIVCHSITKKFPVFPIFGKLPNFPEIGWEMKWNSNVEFINNVWIPFSKVT